MNELYGMGSTKPERWTWQKVAKAGVLTWGIFAGGIQNEDNFSVTQYDSFEEDNRPRWVRIEQQRPSGGTVWQGGLWDD